MTLFEKSLRTIELPAVLEMLKAQTVSEAAKEATEDIAPLTDIYEVREKLSETSAAKKMMEVRGSPSFSGVRDVTAAVTRADMGGVLNTIELMDIAAVLRSAANAISYNDGAGEHTAIDYLFYGLRANKYLENKISTSIVGVDEIADSASRELSDIRRHMRIAGDRARQALNRIISSPEMVKYLQEPIITMRNDRYVVPVKSECKGQVQGLVHDISSSGATLFVEPLAAVQANNEIRELLAKERKEIERILAELSAEVASHGEDIKIDFKTLVALDMVFARAKLSYSLNCAEPELSSSGELVLKAARHPLLPKETAVPVDIRLGGEYDTLVVTGPNTGGKTVALKTIGLLCAMTQCGLHIPTRDGSVIPVFEKILADIGDEQSIEQSLSTFSSHMTTTVHMLEECGENTLLLFDELGAGTDPTEGAALAIAIIEHARDRGAMIAATTHYAEMKIYATTTDGVQNASCEFDVETLRPTYRLLIGIPGKSNAFAISKRLGLPDEIIADAQSRIDSESRSFEEVLQNLEFARQQIEREEQNVRLELRRAEENAEITEKLKAEIQREREKAAQIAKREAERILKEARQTAELVFDELNDMKKKAKKQDWQSANEAKTGVYKVLNDTEKHLGANAEEEAPPPSARPVKAGDRVRLVSLGTEADVISVNTDGSLQLQAGIMKITAKEDEVRLVENRQPKKNTPSTKSARAVTELKREAARAELDIRGMMTDEAIPLVERFLDDAKMGKLNVVTIIHGKGTGTLRKAVHECLRHEKGIKSFRLGVYGEGESGVTVVELK